MGCSVRNSPFLAEFNACNIAGQCFNLSQGKKNRLPFGNRFFCFYYKVFIKFQSCLIFTLTSLLQSEATAVLPNFLSAVFGGNSESEPFKLFN